MTTKAFSIHGRSLMYLVSIDSIVFHHMSITGFNEYLKQCQMNWLVNDGGGGFLFSK